MKKKLLIARKIMKTLECSQEIFELSKLLRDNIKFSSFYNYKYSKLSGSSAK